MMLKDTDGDVTFAALDAKQKKSRIESLNKDAKEAYKEWAAAKKEAGDTFDEPKPKKPAYKIYKKVKGKVKADLALAKLKQRYEDFLAKKQAKETKETEADDLTDDSEATKAEPEACH